MIVTPSFSDRTEHDERKKGEKIGNLFSLIVVVREFDQETSSKEENAVEEKGKRKAKKVAWLTRQNEKKKRTYNEEMKTNY